MAATPITAAALVAEFQGTLEAPDRVRIDNEVAIEVSGTWYFGTYAIRTMEQARDLIERIRAKGKMP